MQGKNQSSLILFTKCQHYQRHAREKRNIASKQHNCYQNSKIKIMIISKSLMNVSKLMIKLFRVYLYTAVYEVQIVNQVILGT